MHDSVLLKFDMKMFVNVARLEIGQLFTHVLWTHLEIGQLFTQGARRGHPCTLDTFLVYSSLQIIIKRRN